MASREEEILELKRRATALKEEGDPNGAMALLAQARDLEFENAQVDDIWEPLKLKQFAVVLKKRGDLEAAKQALLKAKQIEKGVLQQQPQQQQQPPASQPSEPSPEIIPGQQQGQENKSAESPPQVKEQQDIPATVNDSSDEQVPLSSEQQIPQATAADNADNDDGGDGNDDDDLKELMQLDQNDNNEINLDHVSFTKDEMADLEMMTEFKKGGMPVPSDDDYQTEILLCKKSALSFKKAGDTTRALKALQQSKQLEKVRTVLSQMVIGEGKGDIGGDEDGVFATLNEEENELLGELLTRNVPEQTAQEKKELTIEEKMEELTGFLEDPAMLMDAIDMGMEVPTVEELKTEAEKQRNQAVEYKQSGNLEGAKTALLQSKKLAVQAEKLEIALDQIKRKKKNDSKDEDASKVKMEDLEALLEAEENAKAKMAKKSSPEATKEAKKKAAPKEKSSEKLKQEAIRLRDAKKIKEAAEVLKLYKAALKREQEEAEMEKRQQIINKLREEIDYAERQLKILDFYQRFVDTDTQQISLWKEYIARCSNVANAITVKGSGAIKISRKHGALLCVKSNAQEEDFNAMVTDLVEKGTDADQADERLEIAIIDVQKIPENGNLQKFLKKEKREHLPHHPSTIRIEAHIQLPPNEHDTEQSIDLVFEPSTDPLKKLELTNNDEEEPQLPPTAIIGKSQYVDLPRGNSAYGKIIRRRIERNKKIQLTVYHVPVAPKKGGWFWSGKKKGDDDLPPPTVLGKVVLELQGLLTKKCVAAGEFPLMNGSGTKELGGTIRLAVRTGVPFVCSNDQADVANSSGEIEQAEAEVVPYEAMVFSLNQPTTAAEI